MQKCSLESCQIILRMQKKSLLKAQGYWITFVSYAIIHALRMCYSFNKVHLKRQFDISEFYLGMLDTLLYLSYGVGVFFRYEIFQGNQSMKKVFFITTMLISCCFGTVAYTGLFLASSFIGTHVAKILITLGVIGYGFFHLAVYQICGAIVSGYYDPSKESHKLGFWGSSSSVGNIIGFLISNLIVYQLKLKWQVSILIFSILNLLMGFVFYYFLEMPEEDETYKNQLYLIESQNTQTRQEQSLNLNQTTKEKQIRLIHWWTFIKKMISTSQSARFTYIAYIVIKATVYTFLMWFPIFLVSKNLQSVSGYVSTLFDIGGTIGGYLIGKLHQIDHHSQISNLQSGKQSQKNCLHRFASIFMKFRNVLFVFCITMLILSFLLVESSIQIYSPLTLFMGFFLGGTFNNLSSHEIFKIAQSKILLTDMLLNLSVGISAIMIGLVQLLTAFLLKWDAKPKNEQANYQVFFVVLLVMMCLCGIVMIKRVFVNDKKQLQFQKDQQILTDEINHLSLIQAKKM